VQIVEREDYSGDTGTHVDLLISIGRQYLERREIDKARETLEKAYALSRTLQEPSVRARAACILAAPLTVAFELGRAEALVQEGLRELPNEPQFALDRTSCQLRDADVAMTTGEARRAIESVESAERALKDSPVQSEYLKLTLLKTLGAAYSMGARYGEATAAYEEAARHMTRLGYDDTRMAATLLHDWGLAVSVAGRPSEAEPIFRRALDIFRNWDASRKPPIMQSERTRGPNGPTTSNISHRR
jgi:tetratricopeptide (TPR) repeat protein